MVKFFLTLFYFRLPSNVTYSMHLFTLSSCIKSSEYSKYQQTMLLHKIMIISFDNYFPLANIIWSCRYQNHRLFPINDDFQVHGRQRQLFLVKQHFLLFEDKGRLHACCTVTEPREDYCRTTSIKLDWGRQPPTRIESISPLQLTWPI